MVATPLEPLVLFQSSLPVCNHKHIRMYINGATCQSKVPDQCLFNVLVISKGSSMVLCHCSTVYSR